MPSPVAALLNQYRYDPLDRLIANRLPNEPEHQRYYCKSRLATQIHGAASNSIVQHDDQLLAQQQIENGAYETSLLGTDQQRSVLQTTNENDPLQRVSYSPYGYQPHLNKLLSLLGFNGERPDPVTGHYLLGNGYRTFNPMLMRFNSPDNLSPFGKGGVNSYVYCLNDPANRKDPGGQASFKVVAILLRSIHRMKRQTAPIKRALKLTKDDYGSISSIDNGFSTLREGIGPAKETINSPTLQQLSFSSIPGNQLQILANKSVGHARIIKDLDLSIGDINLSNFSRKNYSDNFVKDADSWNVTFEKRTARLGANDSALAGERPGILASRAKLRAIRDHEFPEKHTFDITENRRYPFRN
ncbi:RHS repeat-associated core domain-containing protein [Pseudomonas baetica]|uniref:RHS repeat-associated core domain-containing protein n=1 Tax=Pseudomonas baetica TaxID=674054 RepID=UPI003EEAEBBD